MEKARMPIDPQGRFLVLTEGLFGVRADFAPTLAKVRLLVKGRDEFMVFKAQDGVIYSCNLSGRTHGNARVQRSTRKAKGSNEKAGST